LQTLHTVQSALRCIFYDYHTRACCRSCVCTSVDDAAATIPTQTAAEGPAGQGPGKVAIRPRLSDDHVVAQRYATALVQAECQIPATGMFGHLVQTATLPGPWVRGRPFGATDQPAMKPASGSCGATAVGLLWVQVTDNGWVGLLGLGGARLRVSPSSQLEGCVRWSYRFPPPRPSLLLS